MTVKPTTMKLYCGPVSMFGAKAEIAVLEKGIDCPRDPRFILGVGTVPEHSAVVANHQLAVRILVQRHHVPTRLSILHGVFEHVE